MPFSLPISIEMRYPERMNEVEQRANQVVDLLKERHPAWSWWYTTDDFWGVCFKGYATTLDQIALNQLLPKWQYLTLKVAYPFHDLNVLIASEQISHYIKDHDAKQNPLYAIRP
jgi:hypothetical protein